jgi:CYTH domain
MLIERKDFRPNPSHLEVMAPRSRHWSRGYLKCPLVLQKELELKLAVPPESLPALEKIPLLRRVKAQSKRTIEVSVYFDTDKRTLRKRGLMLRVRRVGHRYV